MRKLILLPLCLAAYLACPYVQLYRLDGALQRGNAKALATGIDWDAVREGLKEDIADGLIGDGSSAVQPASDALPPFGAGFIKGMAGNVVDRMVTPERVAAGFRAAARSTSLMSGARSITTWFDSSTRFEASLQLGGAAAGAAIRLQMDLVRTGWQVGWRVTRVYLPQEVFTQFSSGGQTVASGDQKVFARQ